MQYLFIAALLLGLAVTAAYGIGSKPRQKEQKHDSSIYFYKGIAYSKADVAKKLRQLATSQPPLQRSIVTAMCYAPIRSDPGEDGRWGKPAAKKVNYICPACGNKTTYREQDLSYNFDMLRGRVNSIPNIKVILLEQEFCRHCSPHVQHPCLGLKVKYPGTLDSNIIRPVTEDDIDLIRAFMNGDFAPSTNSELQRKNDLERLEKLLGVRIDQ